MSSSHQNTWWILLGHGSTPDVSGHNPRAHRPPFFPSVLRLWEFVTKMTVNECSWNTVLQSVHLTIIPIPHYTHFIACRWWKKALPRKSAGDVITSQKETIPREGAILANILQRRCSLRKELKIWSWCGKHRVLSHRDECPREPRASKPAELQEESAASLNDVLHRSQLGSVMGKRTGPAQNCILLLVELKVSESDTLPIRDRLVSTHLCQASWQELRQRTCLVHTGMWMENTLHSPTEGEERRACVPSFVKTKQRKKKPMLLESMEGRVNVTERNQMVAAAQPTGKGR